MDDGTSSRRSKNMTFSIAHPLVDMQAFRAPCLPVPWSLCLE